MSDDISMDDVRRMTPSEPKEIRKALDLMIKDLESVAASGDFVELVSTAAAGVAGLALLMDRLLPEEKPGPHRIWRGDPEHGYRFRHWLDTEIATRYGDPAVPDSKSNGLFAFSICPICHAMVQADETRPYGDRRAAHERWHAGLDLPWPASDEGE